MKVEQKLYKRKYLVSSNGTVKRITKTGKVVDKKLTVSHQNNGYVRTTIDYKNEYVHRIVARVFLGEIEGYDVDHIDGNKQNNDVSNLRIITHKENIKYRDQRLGGSLYERSKENNIKKAKKVIWNNMEFSSQSEMAKELNVKQSNISVSIKKGYRVKGHVPKLVEQ